MTTDVGHVKDNMFTCHVAIFRVESHAHMDMYVMTCHVSMRNARVDVLSHPHPIYVEHEHRSAT
eukprot:2932627-Karenia_brevis.AAC.1